MTRDERESVELMPEVRQLFDAARTERAPAGLRAKVLAARGTRRGATGWSVRLAAASVGAAAWLGAVWLLADRERLEFAGVRTSRPDSARGTSAQPLDTNASASELVERAARALRHATSRDAADDLLRTLPEQRLLDDLTRRRPGDEK